MFYYKVNAKAFFELNFHDDFEDFIEFVSGERILMYSARASRVLIFPHQTRIYASNYTCPTKNFRN